jgi:hypothetical protein
VRSEDPNRLPLPSSNTLQYNFFPSQAAYYPPLLLHPFPYTPHPNRRIAIGISVRQLDDPFFYSPSLFLRNYFISAPAPVYNPLQGLGESGVNNIGGNNLSFRDLFAEDPINMEAQGNKVEQRSRIESTSLVPLKHPANQDMQVSLNQEGKKIISRRRDIFIIRREERFAEVNAANLNISSSNAIDDNHSLRQDNTQLQSPLLNSEESKGEIQEEEKKNNKRKLTKAQRIEKKNKKVIAFRFRNVYKFILKRLCSYVEAKKQEIMTKLKDEKEEDIDAAITYILAQKSNPLLKESRRKVNDLLKGSRCTLLIFMDTLKWILEGLIGEEFKQINAKNKETYMSCCKSYLEKSEEKLKAQEEAIEI